MVIDALLGCGQTGNPKELIASLIKRADDFGIPILSLDIPSGLDPEAGLLRKPRIRAKGAPMLALPAKLIPRNCRLGLP